MWLNKKTQDRDGIDDKTSVDLEQQPRIDEEKSVTQPDTPPDGGFPAWVQVILTHIVFFNTWGVANGYGIFQQYYTQTLGESQSSISWIGSVQVFFLFSIGVAAGRLTDAGHFRPIFTCGVFLQLLGIFMTSLSKTYWQIFLAQAVCLGIGNGFTFCPALAVLSQYFKKYRAFAVGLAAAGGAVGGLVYPVLINWLIFKDGLGFPWTLRVMGFLMLATYIPCLIWFKPRLPPRKSGPWIDWSAFRELPFILFSMSMFLNFWGLYFAFFYLGTFAGDKIGISEPIYLLMVLNGVGIFGRIIPNIIADKWTGVLNMLVPLSFSSSILVYCWSAIDSSGGLYAFAVIYGLLAAALQALFPAVATTMTPDPNRTGTRVGMILFLVSFANLTGPAICGALINQDGGNYLGAQMFAGSSILLGAIMALAARLAKTGFTFVAKDAKWFGDDYESIDCAVYSFGGVNPIRVVGIGSVSIPVKKSLTLTGRDSQGTLRLSNVLHVPSLKWNIIGSPVLDDHRFSQKKASPMLTRQQGGKVAALFKTDNVSGLFVLRLSGYPTGPLVGPSELAPRMMASVFWSDSEREKSEEQRKNAKLAVTSEEETLLEPLTEEEEQWLTRHFRNEFEFLKMLGLRIHDDEHRRHGRTILRQTISQKD